MSDSDPSVQQTDSTQDGNDTAAGTVQVPVSLNAPERTRLATLWVESEASADGGPATLRKGVTLPEVEDSSSDSASTIDVKSKALLPADLAAVSQT